MAEIFFHWRKKQALHTKRKFKVLLSALENAINHDPISTKQVSQTTVFPHILSAETIFYFNLEIAANSNSCRNISIFLLNKLNFCCRNYMRKYGMLKFLTAQLVDPEFKIQVTQGVQNIQTRVGTPCSPIFSMN